MQSSQGLNNTGLCFIRFYIANLVIVYNIYWWNEWRLLHFLTEWNVTGFPRCKQNELYGVQHPIAKDHYFSISLVFQANVRLSSDGFFFLYPCEEQIPLEEKNSNERENRVSQKAMHLVGMN